jgi:diguanylate cyclase (GGDEF)-like protein
MAFKVVIIDDMQTNTLLLEALVSRIEDVTTVAFNDPVAAVEWCRDGDADLVLLDYIMPQVGGLEILRQLRKLPCMGDIPVIVVTGLNDRESRIAALEAGANDFVIKPFDEIELIARSRGMLMLRAASRELQRMATTDDLTELPNRRQFFVRLSEEIRRAERFPERGLSVAIVDADHFKQVNDTYGHAAGDVVLKAIAATCRAATRSIDAACRIGGEEFAIIMPETNLAAAIAVCERLRRRVHAMEIPVGEQSLRITVSVGVAEFQIGFDADRLLAEADRLLYRAKEAGRNAVHARDSGAPRDTAAGWMDSHP